MEAGSGDAGADDGRLVGRRHRQGPGPAGQGLHHAGRVRLRSRPRRSRRAPVDPERRPHRARMATPRLTPGRCHIRRSRAAAGVASPRAGGVTLSGGTGTVRRVRVVLAARRRSLEGRHRLRVALGQYRDHRARHRRGGRGGRGRGQDRRGHARGARRCRPPGRGSPPARVLASHRCDARADTHQPGPQTAGRGRRTSLDAFVAGGPCSWSGALCRVRDGHLVVAGQFGQGHRPGAGRRWTRICLQAAAFHRDRPVRASEGRRRWTAPKRGARSSLPPQGTLSTPSRRAARAQGSMGPNRYNRRNALPPLERPPCSTTRPSCRTG